MNIHMFYHRFITDLYSATGVFGFVSSRLILSTTLFGMTTLAATTQPSMHYPPDHLFPPCY